jgi:diguanylate cyclase (GGDEF)-like protein
MLSLLLFIGFCLLVLMMAAGELKRSHDDAYARTSVRLQNNSLLVSEWVKGVFQTSDYLLRDVVANFPPSELKLARTSAQQQRRWVHWLDAKRQTLPHAQGLSLFDPACIQRYTHDARVQSYFDASERDYCRLLRERPVAESVVTPMAMSNFGRYAVTQARLIPGPGPMGNGFVVIGLDTTMFSGLLDRIDTGSNGVITLIDYRQQVVARKPALACVIGKTLDSSMIQAFIDGDVNARVSRHVSLLDGQPQLGVLRKVDGLPLIVYQGEHDRIWLQDWYARAWQIGLAALLLMIVAALLLRCHWVQLALAIRLERDIVQRQRLEEERKLNELALRQARDAAETANRELQLVNAQLSSLATTDTLTGAWNRRHFEQELQRELIQSQRYAEPLSLLMFDIDHFKAVNDRYGHPVGDTVLVGLTRLVQRNLRAADTLARWGGEEFVIMLPHCSADEAASLAEKLRALLAEQTFESVGQVTASFGVAQCRPDDSPQSWLKRADLALYQAKAEGRNAVRLVA